MPVHTVCILETISTSRIAIAYQLTNQMHKKCMDTASKHEDALDNRG